MAKRAPVVRAERVKPTAQTEAKKRPCIINTLYNGKIISGVEQGAAWEILEAFDVITGFLKIRGTNIDGLPAGRRDLSPRAVRLCKRYAAWGAKLVKDRHIRPIVVVEWLEMERPLTSPGETRLLVAALRDWNVVDFPERGAY